MQEVTRIITAEITVIATNVNKAIEEVVGMNLDEKCEYVAGVIKSRMRADDVKVTNVQDFVRDLD